MKFKKTGKIYYSEQKSTMIKKYEFCWSKRGGKWNILKSEYFETKEYFADQAMI